MNEQHDLVLESLAAKLNSLELTNEETAAFGELLGVEPEVAGFAERIHGGHLPAIQGFNIGMPPAKNIDGDFGPATRSMFEVVANHVKD